MKTLIFMPVEFQEPANQIGRLMQLAADGTTGGELTFTVPLFATEAGDDLAPWGFWCAVTLMPANRAAADVLIGQFPGAVIFDYDADANAGFPQGKLIELGLRTARASFPQ